MNDILKQWFNRTLQHSGLSYKRSCETVGMCRRSMTRSILKTHLEGKYLNFFYVFFSIGFNLWFNACHCYVPETIEIESYGSLPINLDQGHVYCLGALTRWLPRVKICLEGLWYYDHNSLVVDSLGSSLETGVDKWEIQFWKLTPFKSWAVTVKLYRFCIELKSINNVYWQTCW